MKTLVSTIAILSSIISYPSLAAPITFDAAGTHGFDFTAIGSDQLRVCTANCLFDITGNAFSGPDTGTFDLGSFGPVTIGPEIAGVFPFSTPNSETFSFLASDGDTLSGNIEWTEIDDDTPVPLAHGLLHVTFSTGDAFFLASWGGAPFDVPIEFTSQADCSLHNLALMNGSCPSPTNTVETVFNDGGVLDRSLVPEPNSISILTIGLITLWGLIVSTRKWKSIVNQL